MVNEFWAECKFSSRSTWQLIPARCDYCGKRGHRAVECWHNRLLTQIVSQVSANNRHSTAGKIQIFDKIVINHYPTEQVVSTRANFSRNQMMNQTTMTTSFKIYLVESLDCMLQVLKCPNNIMNSSKIYHDEFQLYTLHVPKGPAMIGLATLWQENMTPNRHWFES